MTMRSSKPLPPLAYNTFNWRNSHTNTNITKKKSIIIKAYKNRGYDLCVFFSDIVRIFCSMSEIFGATSDKVSEKTSLIAQQYACGSSIAQ